MCKTFSFKVNTKQNMQEELSNQFVAAVQREFKMSDAIFRAMNRWRGQPTDEVEWSWMRDEFLDAEITDAIAKDFYSTYKYNLMYLCHTSMYYRHLFENKKRINTHDLPLAKRTCT